VSEVDVQQRIARLEGLLSRVLQRRGQPRSAPARENGMAAAAPPPAAIDDDVVDLADDDIVEIRESSLPAAAPARAAAVVPSPVPPPPLELAPIVQPPPVQAARVEPAPPVQAAPPLAPVALEQFPVEAEAYSSPATSSDIPVAYEPEPSQPPPARDGGMGWPSSVPPRAETRSETSFAESEPPPPVQAQRPSFGLDFDDEPPASSERSIASSMDEALADAAAREVPLKTPPPESGPQEAVIMPRASALPEPDVDEALPGASEAARIAEGVPTSAQLGNTVTLEEGGAVEFEVEAPAESGRKESAPPPSEDFEIRLPQREAGGTYDAKLAPPPEAQSELDAHRERAAAAVVAPVEPAEAVDALGDTLPDEAEVFERSAVRHGPVTSVTGAPQRFRPGSFLELLDASLKLGKD